MYSKRVAKVLIAEDEVLISLLIKQYIIDANHDVVGIAYDGERAVDLAKQTNPDCILMDIAMKKETDGIEACKAIKQDYPGIKVYFISAYPKSLFEKELAVIPHDGYMDKGDLKSQIAQVL